MTIEYDAERKRATHVESGMAVEFDREGAVARERDTFFRLIWKSETFAFKAGYDFGDAKAKKLYPGLDPVALFQKLNELNEQNYYVRSLPLDVRAALTEMPEFGEVFVALLREVVSRFEGSSRKTTHFRPFFNLNDGDWSAEG